MEPFCKMIGLDSAKDFYNGLVPSSNLPQNLACPLLKVN